MKMMGPITEASQGFTARFKARLAGVFYLLSIITGMFAAFATGRLEVYGNAANLIGTGCYVVVTLLFYNIFKPVNRACRSSQRSSASRDAPSLLFIS